MLYARWLYPAAPCLKSMDAFAFEFSLVPTLEHIDHLKVDFMIVRRRRLFWLERGNEANHMRLHHAVGGRCDTQIAVFRVVAKPFRKIGLAMMTDCEFLFRSRLPASGWLRGSFCL